MLVKLRENNGSMAVYTSVVLLSMLLILTAVFLTSSALRKSGLTTVMKVKESYEADNKRASEIYDALTGNGIIKIKDIRGGSEVEDTIEVADDLGNSVIIPKGFKVSLDSGIKVEDGVVIEDNDGNQFVWVPVGQYKTEDGEKTNNLARRNFSSTGAEEVTESNGDGVIESYYYGEGNSQSLEANTISDFKNSVINNKGFYIGRYEQGIGNVSKAGQEQYTNITAGDAIKESRRMYSNSESVKSELVSSYAWDTALNFMCQNNEEGYVIATTSEPKYGNILTYSKTLTGQYTYNGVRSDCYSNIYDMLGNCWEWSAEYPSSPNGTVVHRGGGYNPSGNYAAFRYSYNQDYKLDLISFRTQLYIKNSAQDDCAFVEDFDTLSNYKANGTTYTVDNGIITLNSSEVDPQIEMYNVTSFNPLTYRYLEIRYKSNSNSMMEFFMIENPTNQTYSVSDMIIADNQWHTMIIDLWSNSSVKNRSNITGWRWDWRSNSSGSVEVDYIKICK